VDKAIALITKLEDVPDIGQVVKLIS